MLDMYVTTMYCTIYFRLHISHLLVIQTMWQM